MLPSLRVDHVVIRVQELAAAVRDYESLGFTVVPGGEHPSLGSRNALIALADGSYLELIAFPKRRELSTSAGSSSPRSAVERRVLSWADAVEGLIDFALLPSS